MDLNIRQRADILRYASSILSQEDRANPVLTGKTALPLLEWAEQATGDDDLWARMLAMSRQHHNRPARVTESGDPAAFVDAARVYYDFLTAGPYGAAVPGVPDMVPATGNLRARLSNLRQEKP